MAIGNRGFVQGLAGTISPNGSGARLPPRTGILNTRDNRLAELAAGTSITRIQELVDPARCRIWDGHNRDYAALNAETCGDLIESFKAQGKQEVPAIVRRVQADPNYDYEVICGARRHWAVSWMRSHDYPHFQFLIEPRELTDEEAFRVADLENRSRRDLSDYERACDYARAIERYYGGSQQRMAERLEVTKSWLSRYLELARLPPEVIGAFGSPHVIGISHSAVLAPLLRNSQQREPLVAAAQMLREEQMRLTADGKASLPPAAVVSRLVSSAKPPSVRHARGSVEHVVRAADGAVLMRAERAGRGGGLTIRVPSPGKHDRSALIAALEEVLERAGKARQKST